MDLFVEFSMLPVRSLDEKSNYSLWHIRVRAVISSRGLNEVSGDTVPDNQVMFTERKQQAGNIIVNALSDPALRVVRSVIGIHQKMLVKLDPRYNSKSTASKTSRISDLVSV